ncbi:MAG TPA: protocatechuate 3,4-dioxygenase subunit alpha [Casimicrobiaceae bacterium]|nr:protocatechuate 3,4-dioxygenase subunit alpha [Casimicrobiaceae bacterium]
MSLLATPSQTAGPFLRIGFTALAVDAIAAAGTAGPPIAIAGTIVDGDRKPVGDAAIEIWQADAEGKYAQASERGSVTAGAFRGFGRILTDADGAFRFSTVKPGAVRGPGGALQAPHLAVTIFMRGLLRQLSTRIYFPDDPANAADPVLQRVPAERRATLIARRPAQEENALRWDVVLQGDGETVFFDY